MRRLAIALLTTLAAIAPAWAGGAAKGLKLTPNLQVIDDPGGVDSRDTAVVLGLTADATF